MQAAVPAEQVRHSDRVQEAGPGELGKFVDAVEGHGGKLDGEEQRAVQRLAEIEVAAAGTGTGEHSSLVHTSHF